MVFISSIWKKRSLTTLREENKNRGSPYYGKQDCQDRRASGLACIVDQDGDRAEGPAVCLAQGKSIAGVRAMTTPLVCCDLFPSATSSNACIRSRGSLCLACYANCRPLRGY